MISVGRYRIYAEKAPLTKRPFNGFAVRKAEDAIFIHNFGGYETRNSSTLRLILRAIGEYRVGDFPWVLVYTMDHDAPATVEGYPTFSYATRRAQYDNVCPDFVFDHWRQTQLDDYTETVRELSEIGETPAETDKLGWRGAPTHRFRSDLVAMADEQHFDFEMINWDTTNPDRLTCPNFLSLPDQIRSWRYLIDMEGHGYSGRLKMFFFSRRVVFLQQRPCEEWYFPDLRPWVHYVPVRRDLSDLRDNFHRIRADPDLESRIIDNAAQFAAQRLTRAAAIRRWAELLMRLSIFGRPAQPRPGVAQLGPHVRG